MLRFMGFVIKVTVLFFIQTGTHLRKKRGTANDYVGAAGTHGDWPGQTGMRGDPTRTPPTRDQCRRRGPRGQCVDSACIHGPILPTVRTLLEPPPTPPPL